MSSPWELQEDRFDDIDDGSETDDKLSNYEDDFYIDENTPGSNQRLNEAVISEFIPPRLSTITEESNIITEGNEVGARGDAYSDSAFGPSFGKVELSGGNAAMPIEEDSLQFRGGGVEKLQRDQESFFRYKKLAQDDYRFEKPCFEKENSWEPSVHRSPPPIPKIHVDELAALNATDSQLIPSTQMRTNPKDGCPKDDGKGLQMDTEKSTPPSASYAQNSKKKSDSDSDSTENYGPKMSTPNSSDCSHRLLRDLSMNCISSIYPEPNTPKSKLARGGNFFKPSSNLITTTNKIPKVEEEEPSLSSSAIDRVLEKEKFDNDDALIKALIEAKARPRLKLNFPEKFMGSQCDGKGSHKETTTNDAFSKKKTNNNVNDNVPVEKIVTKHDRSGVTNKTKRLKTVQELNLLRESSYGTSQILRTIRKEKWNSATVAAKAIPWTSSATNNSNTATVSPCPSSTFHHVGDESHGRFLSCDQSFVYFGFVDIKCRVNRAIRLRNISTKSLNLRLQLQSVGKGYELLEEGIIVLKPEETHNVHIVFEPLCGACFQNILQIKVLNAEHINYSVHLLGSGGVAALRVLSRPGLSMLRDGSFVLTAQGVTNISFDVENKGLRDAFVRIVVLDKETKKAVNGCIIQPSDCISVLRHTKQHLNIEVPSLGSDGNKYNSSRSLPVSSLSSLTGNAQYYVQLLWGEEAQRCRLKRYENEKHADLKFNGYTFTKCKFLHEETCKSAASEDARFGSYDRDAFELGLRITLISVVDNRLSLVSHSQSSPEQMIADSIILEPDATLSPQGSNRSVVEDVSTIFASSRLL